MPIMGGGGGGGSAAGSVDKLVLEAGVNHDSGMNFYQTTTLSTFSKRGTELNTCTKFTVQHYLLSVLSQLQLTMQCQNYHSLKLKPPIGVLIPTRRPMLPPKPATDTSTPSTPTSNPVSAFSPKLALNS